MDHNIRFYMHKPKGELAHIIQAVWSISVDPHATADVEQWLPSDGGCGVIFNLNSTANINVNLNNQTLADGCILQPVSQQATPITLQPGAVLAGIRFHPAISYGLFNELVTKPTLVQGIDPLSRSLIQLHAVLQTKTNHWSRLLTLSRWLKCSFNTLALLPNALSQAINDIRDIQTLTPSTQPIPTPIDISQRQLERYFHTWLGISAKKYQRVLRTRQAQSSIKMNPQLQLADLALDHGFTDQAHMTREFKSIARITPGKYRKILSQ